MLPTSSRMAMTRCSSNSRLATPMPQPWPSTPRWPRITGPGCSGPRWTAVSTRLETREESDETGAHLHVAVAPGHGDPRPLEDQRPRPPPRRTWCRAVARPGLSTGRPGARAPLAAHARCPVRHLLLHPRRAHPDRPGHASTQSGATGGNGGGSRLCGPTQAGPDHPRHPVTRRRPAKCCVRCGRTCIIGWNWPEGFVCTNCVRHGVRTHGPCPECEDERSLPGLDSTGQPVCVDCSGIPTSFRCAICGVEDESFYSHTCLRCSLKRRLSGILDDGSGMVAAAMLPFFNAMVSMGRPRQGLTWLNSAAVRQRLTDLATGVVPLTHEGIDTFGGGPGREYLRELLMAHGVLPTVDKYLLAFERFAQHRLQNIDDPGDRQTITVYLRWRHRRDLVARSEAGVRTERTSGRLIGKPSQRGPRTTPHRRCDLTSRPGGRLSGRSPRPAGHEDLHVAPQRRRGARRLGRRPTRQ